MPAVQFGGIIVQNAVISTGIGIKMDIIDAGSLKSPEMIDTSVSAVTVRVNLDRHLNEE